MKNLYFEDFLDFACDIADKFDELDKENFEDIAVIAKYDETKEIFKELVCIGYDLCNITFERIDWEGYDDEYILSVSSEGIWIEKFKIENRYFEDDSTVMYVLDNCSSKVIPYCKGETVYEVSVGVNDENDEGYTVNGITVTKDEFDEYVSKFRGSESKSATTSSASYYVNGKKTDKDTYDKAVSEIEDKYLDNMRDMLLNYAKWMDEVNEHLKLFRW